MTLKIENVRYGKDKMYSGYFCTPVNAGGPVPAILVLQEAWGVDDHIEDVTRRFAEAGYATLAPDLFAAHGKRPAPLTVERLAALLAFLNTMPPSEAFDPEKRAKVMATLPSDEQQKYNETMGALFGPEGVLHKSDAHVENGKAAIEFLGQHEATKGRKVGAVGFCMGGGVAASLAVKAKGLSAAASLYGRSPDPSLASQAACPILGLYGENDAHVNGTIAPFAEAMKAAGKRYETHIYTGAQHAFFNDRRPVYNIDASRDAFVRLLTFFRDELV